MLGVQSAARNRGKEKVLITNALSLHIMDSKLHCPPGINAVQIGIEEQFHSCSAILQKTLNKCLAANLLQKYSLFHPICVFS